MVTPVEAYDKPKVERRSRRDTRSASIVEVVQELVHKTRANSIIEQLMPKKTSGS
jgi:hypothetical protein